METLSILHDTYSGVVAAASTIDPFSQIDSPILSTSALLDSSTTLAPLLDTEDQFFNQVVLPTIQTSLQAFSKTIEFDSDLHLAFGYGCNLDLAHTLISELANGAFLPQIQILPRSQLNAEGAFGNPRIFLAEELLTPPNASAAVNVLLEELGHYIDAQINLQDSPGDEGAIFAKLVQNQPFAAGELAALKSEDDHSTLIVNNQTIVVEHADPPGVFVVDSTGNLSVDFWTDGGEFESEIAIFSLEGMESLAPGSIDFIREAARRSLSNSTLGHEVILDAVEGARFSGEAGERDQNHGTYAGGKTFGFNGGDRIAMMLVPQGTVQEVFNNPNVGGSKRPLFSIASANPSNGNNLGQLAPTVFAWEDLRFDQGSDADYNDMLFQVRGLTGYAPDVGSLLASGQDWRNTSLTQQILTFLSQGAVQTPRFTLDPLFDVAPLGDSQTTFVTVNLVGQTTANASVTLKETGDTVVADAAGQFTFKNIRLTVGDNSFTTIAKDVAGTVSAFTDTIIRIATDDNASENLTLQIIPSLERVAREGSIDVPALTNFASARGEYESFQVVIQAPLGNLTNVDISISDFRDADGHVIDQTNLDLYREHYVEVRSASPTSEDTINQSLGIGWYADALIPEVEPSSSTESISEEFRAFPFNLEVNHNQPIWVDVFVPRNTPAGEYKSRITVTSDQGTVEGDVVLKVWDFELPQTPSLQSSFTFWDTDDPASLATLLENRLMSRYINPSDQSVLVEQGLSSADLGFWSGADNDTCMMNPAPSIEELQAELDRYEPGLFLYNKTADEIDGCTDLFDIMKEWGRNLHAVGVANLVTMTPTSELYDVEAGRSSVDIWVVLPIMYDEAPQAIAEALQRGEQVWSYNVLIQDEYSPKWEIDFAPINFRIQPGFINQSLGLTGLLYWRVDLWTDDPWHDVQTYTQDNGNSYPGEGMLVYPGGPVGVEGVVPSMRLKWLRDGVDDYDYIQILKELGQDDWALEMSRSIGLDWQTWTKDPATLADVRFQMGQEIERLITEEEEARLPDE